MGVKSPGFVRSPDGIPYTAHCSEVIWIDLYESPVSVGHNTWLLSGRTGSLLGQHTANLVRRRAHTFQQSSPCYYIPAIHLPQRAESSHQ